MQSCITDQVSKGHHVEVGCHRLSSGHGGGKVVLSVVCTSCVPLCTPIVAKGHNAMEVVGGTSDTKCRNAKRIVCCESWGGGIPIVSLQGMGVMGEFCWLVTATTCAQRAFLRDAHGCRLSPGDCEIDCAYVNTSCSSAHARRNTICDNYSQLEHAIPRAPHLNPVWRQL